MKNIELTEKSNGKYITLAVALTSIVSIPYIISGVNKGSTEGAAYAIIFLIMLLISSFIFMLTDRDKYSKISFTALSTAFWIFYFFKLSNDTSSHIFFLTYPLFIFAIISYKKALVINLVMLTIFCYRYLLSYDDLNLKIGTVYLMLIIISSVWKKFMESNFNRVNMLALYDNLTGVANIKHFNMYTENLLSASKRKERSFSLLYIDIDDFKKINDSFGHDVGDKVLKKVIYQLKGSLRDSDFISRNGGDKFIVVLPEIDDEYSPAMIADRIMNNRETDSHLPTLSIGIVNYPEDGSTVKELLKKSKNAMLQAKKEGKNTFSFFHKGFDEIIKERFIIASQLKTAINNEELDVVFQPKIDTNTQRVSGAEALIRWNNALLGVVSPADFISIAEDSEIIHTISSWVYVRAFEMLKKIHDLGHDNLILSVNVSPHQISKETLIGSLDSAIEKTGVSPEFIELEITEGILLQNNTQSANQLETLRNRGFKISIDDFGTGYSSLSYLQKLNIDTIKIDQSFIQNIGNANSYNITKAIISMAKSLNLQTVAEGVETGEQMRLLEKMGCNLIQGFYFSKPLKEDDFMNMLSKKTGETLEIGSKLINKN